jgi:hypothetical protein
MKQLVVEKEGDSYFHTIINNASIKPFSVTHYPNNTIQNQPDLNISLQCKEGVRGGVVVKALRYKLSGRGFDSRWCHWNFSVT